MKARAFEPRVTERCFSAAVAIGPYHYCVTLTSFTQLAGSSSERKACETLGLQELLAFENKLGWHSDAIRANLVQSFGYTSEGFQEFLGLESVLVEEVHVPSGVARSWAWCSPAKLNTV